MNGSSADLIGILTGATPERGIGRASLFITTGLCIIGSAWAGSSGLPFIGVVLITLAAAMLWGTRWFSITADELLTEQEAAAPH